MGIEKSYAAPNPEKKLLSDSEKTTLISLTNSFQELYPILNKIGPVQGSQVLYSTNDLIRIIQGVRVGLKTVDFITNTYGLRDTVERLLAKTARPEKKPYFESAVALELPKDEDKNRSAAQKRRSPEVRYRRIGE